jgi:outer membrane lipoprotein SlyB
MRSFSVSWPVGPASVLAMLVGCAAQPMPMPEPPPPTVAPLPDTNVYVYPAAGQDAEQLDRDRYECHQWSVHQTGFDPSVPQVAPHQQVQVVAMPPPGTSAVAGAATGAIIGAAVSSPYQTGSGALIGAAAGALMGAAADSARAQQAADAQRRVDAANDQRDYGLDQLADNYRRALSACLQGRGYTVK